MTKFIVVTDRYGKSYTIYINVDSIESIAILKPDSDDANPPLEITTHNRTFYVNETLREIFDKENMVCV